MTTNWLAAALATVCAGGVLTAWSARDQMLPGTGAVVAGQVAQNVGLAAAIGAVVALVVWLLGRRRRGGPALYTWALVTTAVVLFTLPAGATPLMWFATVAAVLVACGLVGLALRRPSIALAGAVVLVVPVAVVIVSEAQPPAATALPRAPGLAGGIDPAAPGPHPVRTVHYGSGGERQASGPGDEVVQTEPVDLSAVVSGWREDRTDYYGVEPSAFPVAGEVFVPEGITRPAPLVLLVHGNISTVADSDTGLAYLGRQLAGYGFVAATIDENFLNTGPWDRSDGLGGVAEARARMILAHLDQWQRWDRDPGSPFHRVVDTSRIGLIGHSRGGEAISAATHLDAEEGLGHGIESLLALAPSDGQYRTGGPGIRLSGVDYLVLQGAQDADVIDYGGLDQLGRVDAGDGERILGAVVAEGLDHSGFNAVWPGPDIGYGLPKIFLDDGRLHPEQEQRMFAAAWATSWMKATLGGGEGARESFVDQAVEAGQSAGGHAAVMMRLTGGEQLASVEVEGGRPGAGEEVGLPLRGGEGDLSVRRIGWSGPGAQIRIAVPAGALEGHAEIGIEAVSTGEPVQMAVALDDGDTPVELDDLVVGGPVDATMTRAAWMQTVPAAQAVPRSYLLPIPDTVRSAGGELSLVLTPVAGEGEVLLSSAAIM